MNSTIYKIVSRQEWDQAIESGSFDGSQVDKSDGFIHFSTKQQVRETARKHFAGQDDLLLVAVDSVGLEDLKWEPSRGGDLFPHLYAHLDVEKAISVDELPLTSSGHVFPPSLTDQGDDLDVG